VHKQLVIDGTEALNAVTASRMDHGACALKTLLSLTHYSTKIGIATSNANVKTLQHRLPMNKSTDHIASLCLFIDHNDTVKSPDYF
jgi:hypothetical protein